MSGVELIAAERERQVNVEGWTPEHDDAHLSGELATAAACYAQPIMPPDQRISTPESWPWEEKWWKPRIDYRNFYIRNSILVGHTSLRIADLVKSGALIAAEIDRLQRGQNPA